MACVLDSDALLDFFRDEGAAVAVEELLVRAERAKQRVWITPLTWSEVYYRALKASKELADRYANEMAILPIDVYLEQEDLALSRETARLRATMKNMDISTLSSVALAKIKKAELWTTHKDIAALSGGIKIKLIGAGGA